MSNHIGLTPRITSTQTEEGLITLRSERYRETCEVQVMMKARNQVHLVTTVEYNRKE